MWLLDTHTLKLHYFTSPEAVEEGYMILSHVWDEDEELEMSCQDMQCIHERCAVSGEDPHDLVNTKIRMCCELGKQLGYKWAWIDTCCIDKTSSAELMETINAMYQYYALSLVCYVYLPDLWHNEDPAEIRSAMHNSENPEHAFLVRTRWQKRGWTLQELIAPRVVHFLSSVWGFLGTRNDLADYLEAGLGIPASVLRHEQSPLEFGVAQRMSWAAKRRTTRIEDEAYCLLGLFGINMPTLYGEGRKAFQRLQEEILKQTDDTTLSAWGRSDLLESLRDYPGHAQTGLLASAPSDFKSSRNLRTIPRLGSNSALHRRITFRTTPHGPILTRMPVLHLNGQAFGDLSWYQGEARLLLVLTKCNHPSHLPYPIYDVGVDDGSVTSQTFPLRLAKIDHFQENVSAAHANLRGSIRTILLVRHRAAEDAKEPIYLPLNHSFPPSIRLPEHLIRSILHRPTVTEMSITNAQLPWLGNPPLIITFRVQTQEDVMYATVLFGTCTSHATEGQEFWATFRGGPSRSECADYNHQCTEDHVVNWPSMKRHFVVKIHAIHKGLGDHVTKWMFDMEFTHFIHTGTLILTGMTLDVTVLFPESGYRDLLEERGYRIKQTQALHENPDTTHAQESNGSSTLATTIEKIHSSAIESSARRHLCPASLLHRLIGECHIEPFIHQVQSFPSSISAIIQWAFLSLQLDDPLSDRSSLVFIYPPTLHRSDLGSEDLSLLLP